MSILAPVSVQIFWMVLPPEPMTSRILSTGIFMEIILGAYSETSARGSAMQGSIISLRISSRAFRVRSKASAMISMVRPLFFRSI